MLNLILMFHIMPNSLQENTNIMIHKKMSLSVVDFQDICTWISSVRYHFCRHKMEGRPNINVLEQHQTLFSSLG